MQVNPVQHMRNYNLKAKRIKILGFLSPANAGLIHRFADKVCELFGLEARSEISSGGIGEYNNHRKINPKV